MTYGEVKIRFRNNEELVELLGSADENIRLWEELLDVKFRLKGDELILSGEKGEVQRVAEALRKALREIAAIPYDERRDFLNRLLYPTASGRSVAVTATGKAIKPLTEGQQIYIDKMLNHDITLCIGPAGTGKTYLGVACGVSMLREGKVERIVLTRPAVEAGESLGYLPGTIAEKIDPYLRPLYDALYDSMGIEKARRLIDKDVIEIAPLAYMRGRTLKNAFIILDEAQNAKRIQMKMFLTRMGPDSRVVITGDVTQIDLPGPKDSGLLQAIDYLNDVEGVAIVRLTYKDVVRHPIVSRIIRAYENAGKRPPSGS